MKTKLTAEDVSNVCSIDVLKSISQPVDIEEKVIIGQDRAIKALKLGLGMKASKFNIYVSGATGTGKLTAVTSFVEKQAGTESVPADWCYVNNFKDAYCPKKLALPPGAATKFKKEMKTVVADIHSGLIKSFEGEDYDSRKEKIINAFEDKQADIMGAITAHAEKDSFMVKQTRTSIITIPLKNGKAVTDAQLKDMGEAELDAINDIQNKLQDEINAGLREIRKYEKKMNEDLDHLAKEVARYAIDGPIEELESKYKTIRELSDYLQTLRADILDNLPEFIKSQKGNGPSTTDNFFLKRYEVTVLVDNSETKGAPVIIERNPTYNNLLGRVEKESYMGSLVTDFTMIRRGALHSANGGYLILRVEELLQNYFSWDCLKRALNNKEIVIEEATDQLGYVTTRTLKPESIPLNVKVILIGNAYQYQLLYEYDNDFRELFKVKADFDSEMPRTDGNIAYYAAFVNFFCNKEGLPVPDGGATAKIIEYSSRLAQDQNKLSTHFGAISDIIREAGYYAVQDGNAKIMDCHILKSIDEKHYRSNLVQEKINEMIVDQQIFIDISGAKAGQINGLSVIDIGDISFGIPARITCSVSLGKAGVIAIEREAEMSGPIHTKGVLILAGYLAGKFMQDKPLNLSARLVFEQSYSEIEGDSASSTELYAILSALSSLPIKQGIAVTGSVNQKGEIQPIGGINEKIEGYFEICKRIGLNGEQGVIIPAANVRNMMLKEDVRSAITEGQFNIWAIDTIDDGIAILTGIAAGSIWEEDTVFYYVNNTLNVYTERMKHNGGQEEEELVEIN